MPPNSDDPERSGSQLISVPLPGCAGLRLSGEVDITNHHQLRSALAALPADGLTTLHLDVSRLFFIDVAGTNELLALVRSQPCLRLILHNPPASLRRIVTLLWTGPNIEIRSSCPGDWPGDGPDGQHAPSDAGPAQPGWIPGGAAG